MSEEEREQAFHEIVRGLMALGYTADDKVQIASLFTAILSGDEPHVSGDLVDL